MEATSSGNNRGKVQEFLQNMGKRLRGDVYDKTLKEQQSASTSSEASTALRSANRRTSSDDMNYKCDACGSCLSVAEAERALNADDETDRKCPLCGGSASAIRKLPSIEDILAENRQGETI